jgi:hypothetical protein
MPWIDSTKKNRRKTASGNGRFAIFSTKSYIWRFLRQNTGYLLVSAVFLYCFCFVESSNHGVIRTFEKAANKKKLSLERFTP